MSTWQPSWILCGIGFRKEPSSNGPQCTQKIACTCVREVRTIHHTCVVYTGATHRASPKQTRIGKFTISEFETISNLVTPGQVL
jgi:hypothetical protein